MNGPWQLLEGKDIEGRYRLEKFIDEGGYGAVFRASEVVQDYVMRPVAVKLMLVEDKEKDRDRQLQELRTARNVQHPNLIRCFSCGETSLDNQHFFFLVMELAEYSLEQSLQKGKLTAEATKQLLQDIAEGSLYLHTYNIFHRDLAPGNILWTEGRWKIGDFGLTRQVKNGSHGVTTKLAGREGFASPEAYDGIYSAASDIWSLGIVTVYALTRRLPFNHQTSKELQKCVINCDLAIPQLPSPFIEIVQGCLKVIPQERQTAQQILNILKSTNVQTYSAPKKVARPISKPSWKEPKLIGTGIGLILITLTAILFISRRIEQQPNSPLAIVNTFYNSIPFKSKEISTILTDDYQQDYLKLEKDFWSDVERSELVEVIPLGESSSNTSFQIFVRYHMKDKTTVCERRIIELVNEPESKRWLIDKNINLTNTTECQETS